MSTQSPVEELRAAAKVLRETASKATPGPWEIRDGNKASSNVATRDEHMVIDGGGWTDGKKAVVYGAALVADAAWIALMSPAVAEPLAVLLDEAAKRRESAVAIAASVSDEDETITADDIDTLTPLTLAFARQILGRQP